MYEVLKQQDKLIFFFILGVNEEYIKIFQNALVRIKVCCQRITEFKS